MSTTICTFNGGPKHLLEMPVDDNARKMMFPGDPLPINWEHIPVVWVAETVPMVQDKSSDPHVYVRLSRDQFIYVEPNK